MKKYIISILLVTHLYTHCSLQYILCVDGGGSKTALQVVDIQGNLISLINKDTISHAIIAGSSNLNVVGIKGVSHALHALIDNTKLEDGAFLRDILPHCYVVAGMAGVQKETMTELFEAVGVTKDKLLLMGDAELALQSIRGEGAILIAGTGSICLGKKDNNVYRVGGLGYLLGDEGSGYAIGLQALKVALAHEYGWGKPTSLTTQLCALYGVSQLKEVMKDIYADATQYRCVQKISRATPTVIAQALAQDEQALVIVHNAAIQLTDLVVGTVCMADLHVCEIHLWGGLFKSDAADIFIKTIEQHPIVQQRNITLINQSHHNATTFFVQQKGSDLWKKFV